MAYDYEKLGLKAGLEIHQQLDTGKLFSNSPSYLRKDKPDYVIRRRLHAVAGETGEVDVAVKHEAALEKEYHYEGYDDTVSLVELDEEPPRPIDQDALSVALQISLLMDCEVYPVTQVMRKTVIDGSNTSGFQRTVLIAHDGFIETSFGKVPVESVCLEEDAARIIKREKDKTVFRLDRLGIPLIEIATAPAMTKPEQVKEAALKIGEILRACRVKRGIGTIRQDVNVSIRGHERVEIKGFQDPRMMVKTIDLEIARQLGDIKKKDKAGGVRNALPDGKTKFLRPLPGRARMYPETDHDLITISRGILDALKKDLPRLKADVKEELEKKGLSEELVTLVLAGNVDEFTTLSDVYEDPSLVAKMVTLWRHDIARKLGKSIDEIRDVLTERVLEEVLEALDKGRIEKSDVRDVLLKIGQGVAFEDALNVEKASHDEIEETIRKIVKEKPGLRPNAYMGLVMKEFRGKLDAKKAMEIINKVLGQ